MSSARLETLEGAVFLRVSSMKLDLDSSFFPLLYGHWLGLYLDNFLFLQEYEDFLCVNFN